MKKAVITAVALTLVACMAIGGTLAYLMDKTTEVKNVFSVGDINIELKENTTGYKVVPGGTEAKDPYVTVKANSEACYVYVCIENNMIIDGKTVVTYDIKTTGDDVKWVQIATKDNKVLYRYKDIVTLSTADQELPVFTTVSYSDGILKTDIQDLKGKTIVLTAFAHQSANIEVSVADAEAKVQLGVQ